MTFCHGLEYSTEERNETMFWLIYLLAVVVIGFMVWFWNNINYELSTFRRQLEHLEHREDLREEMVHIHSKEISRLSKELTVINSNGTHSKRRYIRHDKSRP